MEPLPQPSPLPTSRASPQQASATPRSGRKKIRIIRITDSRSRQVTFLKRKNGLLKKAHELSILCGCNVAVVIFNNDNGKLYEYFNPSAEETFQRYAVYTGVSERRRSDVMELEEAKGSCDIPNDEPEVAEAALRAANMSAIRHAHPENYEYPPPGRPQIHPNVTVPAIRMTPPPLPVHPVMGGNASRNSIAGPSRRPVPVHSPPAVDSSPKTHTLALAGRNRNAVHKNYSYAHAKTPQVARALPFHVEEHPVAPQTARNQSPGRFGLPPLLPNEQSQQRVNSYPQVIPSTGEPVTYRNSQFSTITVRKASRTVGGIFSGQWAEGQHNSDKSLRTAPNPEDEEMIPLFIDRKMRVHGTEMGAERPTLNRPLPAAHASTRPPGVGLLNRPVCSAISADETPAQPSPLSTISPWTGEKNIAGSREMTPCTPSEQPWNNPFFRQQMQESERFNAQPMLPSLNPLLGHLPDSEFQQNGIDSTMGNMLNQARLDTLPSRSDPGLLPLSRSGTSDYNPLASVGTVRRRTSSELREHMDRQRPKR